MNCTSVGACGIRLELRGFTMLRRRCAVRFTQRLKGVCNTPLQLAQTLNPLLLLKHPENYVGHGKNYIGHRKNYVRHSPNYIRPFFATFKHLKNKTL